MHGIFFGIIVVLVLLEMKVLFYRRDVNNRDWRSDDGTSRYNGSNWTGGGSSDSWVDFFTGGGDGSGPFDGGHCGGDGGGDCGGGH